MSKRQRRYWQRFRFHRGALAFAAAVLLGCAPAFDAIADGITQRREGASEVQRTLVMASLLMLRNRGPVASSTLYAHLAPEYATLPTGVTFNEATGRYDGTVVDTTEPTWATTNTSLTDSGNAATNMSNLQTLLNTVASTATGNTRIILPVALYAGTLTLPANTTGFWIGLYTASHSSLPTPAAGTVVGTVANRVNASHKTLMPELYATAGNAATIVSAGSTTQKYYARGLFFSNRGAITSTAPVRLFEHYPKDITFLQCVSDFGDFTSMRRAYALSGERVAVVDSWGDNIGEAGADSQFVWIAAGPGPIKVVNTDSRIGGGAENILSGGQSLPGSDDTYLPRDLELRGNHFYHPVGSGAHKNGVEIKYGVRVLIEGNVFGYHNGAGQSFQINIKLTDQGGTNVFANTTDVVIANNTIPEGPGGITVVGAEAYSGTLTTRRVDIINNLIEPPTTDNVAGLQIGDGINGQIVDVSARFNTICGGTKGARFLEPDSAENMQLVDNVIYGVGDFTVRSEAGGGNGADAFDFSTLGTSTFARNLVATIADSRYSAQIQTGAETFASLGFVDSDNGDYALTSSSEGYQAALGGQDVGVNMPLLSSIVGGVL